MPAERIPDRPKHKSIIFQATCKNTYAVLRLLLVVSDGNFHHPVNYTSFNVFAFAYRYYKG